MRLSIEGAATAQLQPIIRTYVVRPYTRYGSRWSLYSAGMCTLEGNAGTVPATGTSPHTATTGCSHLCNNDFTGTIAGNRHYSGQLALQRDLHYFFSTIILVCSAMDEHGTGKRGLNHRNARWRPLWWPKSLLFPQRTYLALHTATPRCRSEHATNNTPHRCRIEYAT